MARAKTYLEIPRALVRRGRTTGGALRKTEATLRKVEGAYRSALSRLATPAQVRALAALRGPQRAGFMRDNKLSRSKLRSLKAARVRAVQDILMRFALEQRTGPRRSR